MNQGLFILKKSQRRFATTVCLILTLFVTLLASVLNSSADATFSWMNGAVSAKLNETATTKNSMENYSCTEQLFSFVNAANATEQPKLICFHDAGTFRYGRYIDSNYTERLAVSFGADARFYSLEPSVPLKGIIPIPNSTSVIFRDNTYDSLVWYKDFASQLEQVGGPGLHRSYRLKTSAIGQRFVGNPNGTRAIGVSNNGKWALIEVVEKGIMRINLETGEKRFVSKISVNYGFSSLGSMRLAIANDGRSGAVITTSNQVVRMIDIDSVCGRDVDENEIFEKLVNQCTTRDISEYVRPVLYRGISELIPPTFNDDGGELYIWVLKGESYKQLVVSAHNYNPPRLAYLALGDSYSSGEGDIGKRIDGSSFYTAKTSGPGGCHLSTRSYPFLLRATWGFSSENMQSVACSGAKVGTDYTGQRSNYFGQHGEINQQQDVISQEILRDNALDEFLPGYVPQVEFVKKYRPSIITLTGGGNDVGFSKILETCVLLDTCLYAGPNSELSDTIKNSINNQAKVIRDLINQLKIASSDARIIVIGYPKFIKTDGTCFYNSAFLNKQEREMINENLERLNGVLESEAARAGVEYANVEDSLQGGQMCEGSEYVTGIWDVGLFNAMDANNAYARAQLFHPNAAGHERLAATISANASVLSEALIKDGGPQESAFQYSFIDNDLIMVDDELSEANLPNLSFEPNSSISVTGYSEPVDLGTFTANADGSLRAQIPISSLGTGYHTVVLKGRSFSGEPLTYYQFVTIGSTDDDIDGDGIKNEVDRCQFVKSWFDETNGKDICVQANVTEIANPETSDNSQPKQDTFSKADATKSEQKYRSSIVGDDPVSTPSVKGATSKAADLKKTTKSQYDLDNYSVLRLVILSLVGILVVGVVYAIYKKQKN